jgi:hypothetical protein
MKSARERLAALRKAEDNLEISDSMKVRKELMARYHSGEWTLVEVQLELDRVKRNGKLLHKMTRDQFLRGW